LRADGDADCCPKIITENSTTGKLTLTQPFGKGLFNINNMEIRNFAKNLFSDIIKTILIKQFNDIVVGRKE
jgi:hypothetical protein